MDTFTTWIGLRSQDELIKETEEHLKAARIFLKKKAMPAVLAGAVFTQVGQVADYERILRSQSFGKIVQEDQSGAEDHSMPEPAGLAGTIVATTTASTVMVTGDQAIFVAAPSYTLVQITNDDVDNFEDREPRKAIHKELTVVRV